MGTDEQPHNDPADHTPIDKSNQSRQQRVVSQALAPFEDALIAQLPTLEQITERAANRQKRNKQRYKGTALAILASVLGGAFWLDPAYQTSTQRTAIGQQAEWQLSDGSKIQLNTNTKVTVAMHLRSRRISLQQGEAIFHVSHSPWHSYLPRLERPFTVQAGDIQVRDIGTVFNVRLTPEQETQVTVLQGRVLVSETHGTNPKQITLGAGQAIYSQNSKLQQRTQVDPEQNTAWQHGRIYFYNQTLAEVLQELNRYGELPVVIKDQSTGKIRISAQVDIHNRERFIALLPGFAPVTLKQDKDGIASIEQR
ncbi:FecR family protein [Acinetobacter puyangensis]|uniref:FecR family protein n=1 Tax=Acinetobacter puyangensis TaxID=1096779 RepID=A0A240E6Z9_9GAMM|nr:FecR domain-containing protein [Acinetobacter puyangensis]SNX43665.1 FecR family protein [Acinetobacter puyangensis]